jgi:glycosyltransferase involved in cell wall biosynthesis
MPDTIVLAANRGYALKSSRTLLIQRLLKAGCRVVLATADDAESRELAAMGAILEPVHFARSGLAPIHDLRALLRMRSIYRRHRPRLVHHFHSKPIIAGTCAALLDRHNRPAIVNTITGLGHAFIAGGLQQRVVETGFRFALPRADTTIFQNSDDLELFRNKGLVRSEQARMILGSGIDLQHHAVVDRSTRAPGSETVLMIGRLLGQKGIREFAEIATAVRRSMPGVSFLLAGEEDPTHPDAMPRDWISRQHDIAYAGRVSDVRALMAKADLLLFPSYREGVPRVVIEAAASGLPTVAFDVPGVREAVEPGVTGILIPFGDVRRMAEETQRLLVDGHARNVMGAQARTLAERRFDVREVTASYLQIYRTLGLNLP